MNLPLNSQDRTGPASVQDLSQAPRQRSRTAFEGKGNARYRRPGLLSKVPRRIASGSFAGNFPDIQISHCESMIYKKHENKKIISRGKKFFRLRFTFFSLEIISRLSCSRFSSDFTPKFSLPFNALQGHRIFPIKKQTEHPHGVSVCLFFPVQPAMANLPQSCKC